jgi:branched-chain amino acid aminotransferase
VTTISWIDGEFTASDEIGLSPLTHSLSYATSIFEGMRCFSRKIFKPLEHLHRLRRSAAIFGHTVDYSDEQLAEACDVLIHKNGLGEAYIKIVVFYDDTDPSFMARGCASRIIISVLPFAASAEYRSYRLATASWRRPPATCHPYQAKTSSTYALSFLGFRSKPAGYDDVLFLSTDDTVCESSGSNIFFVDGDVLVTPTIELALDGITRRTVIDMLTPRLGLQVSVREIPYSEIGAFDAAFLCGTATEIAEVSAIDDFRYQRSTIVANISSEYGKIVRQP